MSLGDDLDPAREQIRRPRCVPDTFSPSSPLDPMLLDYARNERATKAGLTPEDFMRCNVAVVRVHVDGQKAFLTASNLPHADGGIHSEEFLLHQVATLRARARSVVVDQLYSERKPCREICRPLIERTWPGAAIFYSVSHHFNPKDRTRAEALMRAYDLR